MPDAAFRARLAALRMLAGADVAMSLHWGMVGRASVGSSVPPMPVPLSFGLARPEDGRPVVGHAREKARLPSALTTRLDPPLASWLICATAAHSAIFIGWAEGASLPGWLAGHPEEVAAALRVLLAGSGSPEAETLLMRLSAVMAAVPQGLVLVDDDTSAALVNPQAAALLGVEAGEVAPAALRDGFRRLTARLDPAAGVEAAAIDMIARNAGLEDWLWELRGEPRRIYRVMSLPLARGALAGRLWVFDDVTALKTAEQDLLQRNRELDALNRTLSEMKRAADSSNQAKSIFLATMSHEIRTPMNAVLGLAGRLLDDELPLEQHRMVEIIHDSADVLLRILNDILDLSKMDAGQMSFEEASFSPVALTRSVVSVLGPQASAKGLAVVAEYDPALPQGLIGDAGRIRQTILNLASNAVKFTPAGSVTIRAECVTQSAVSASIRWIVRDTGIGIPADRIGNLFGEFVQADSSISRRFGGSGLGLAISRRLTTQMGGTIGVTSKPGEGSTFTVDLTLPVAEMRAEPRAGGVDSRPAVLAMLRERRQRARILVAEDNATNQLIVRHLLKNVDIDVDVVGNGREAVAAAARVDYAAIFMDMRMPEMDGLEAARAIRGLGGRLAEVPIIALTASVFPEDIRACREAGMDHFLPKPVSKDMLLAAMYQVLSETPPPSDAVQVEEMSSP